MFLGFSQAVYAAETPPEIDLEGVETVPLENEIPLELDPISITSERYTVKQEAAMRMVRQALQTERSHKKEDIDELVCWFDRGVGTRIKYLYCARNGDLWALEPDPYSGNLFGGTGTRQVPGYGKIMRSSQTMQPGRFKQMVSLLPGTAEQDKEFVSMAMAGHNPPRNLPRDEEMEAFARAYLEVDTLSDKGASDDQLEKAIEEQGLTLVRYNQMIDLVDHYPSLRNTALERVTALNNP
jgi:hypothetical protein